MTGNNYLLDSNIVIEFFDGNKIFADKISKEETLYLPSIVLGEIYTGVNSVIIKPNTLRNLSAGYQFCILKSCQI